MSPPLMKPRTHIRSGEGAVVSVDYFDLFSGIGYKEIYGGVYFTDAATKPVFSSKEFLSHVGSLVIGAKGGGSVTLTERNFNFPVEKTLTIKNMIMLQASIRAYTASSSETQNILFKLYKVSLAGVETQIGSTITVAAQATPSTSYTYVYGAFEFTGNLVLEKGQYLRLEVTCAGVSLNTTSFDIYCSPTNTGTSTSIPNTQLNLLLPLIISP